MKFIIKLIQKENVAIFMSKIHCVTKEIWWWKSKNKKKFTPFSVENKRKFLRKIEFFFEKILLHKKYFLKNKKGEERIFLLFSYNFYTGLNVLKGGIKHK